jgi:ppGpp synthetase/RelA/SpoT-type nucleotidyltranferase
MKQVDPSLFSKTQSDRAGKILSNEGSSQEEKDQALEILSNWRAAHNYPLQVFFNRLKRVAQKIDSTALTAQRLKRVPSILKKLSRVYPGNEKATMKLTQMQDIAGCRAVLEEVSLVKKLYKEEYLEGDLKHERVKVSDYIKTPKEDGYRSIHIVYRYFSDKGRSEYNGLLVEVQMRSRIQHIWATAVETVGFFTKQAIKSNEGEKEWLEFFKLVSSAFAIMEECPLVKGTPYDKEELCRRIREKEKELNIKQRMKIWTESIHYVDNNLRNKKEFAFYLLELDTNLDKLSIRSYSKRQEKKAIAEYLAVEKRIYGKNAYDVVLVGAETLQDLKKAYPNYFLDTKEFLKKLEIVLQEKF